MISVDCEVSCPLSVCVHTGHGAARGENVYLPARRWGLNLEPLSILLLSDVHFGKDSISPDFALRAKPPSHVLTGAVPMKGHLIEVAKGQNIKIILVAGDLTSTASPAEFRECSEALREIATGIGVAEENVFHTFGNHDVNWSVSSLGDAVKPKDDGYSQVAASIGDMFIQNPRYDVSGPVPGCGVWRRDGLVLCAVNTGYSCKHDQAYPHGQLGNEQLEWLRTQLDVAVDIDQWHVLLMHHHPQNYEYPTPMPDISCIEEGAELLTMLGNSTVDLVCHGHRHFPKLFSRMETGWESPITFLCAASLSVNVQERRLGELPNMFHIVTLETRGEDSAAIGTLKSFTYNTKDGWSSHNHSGMLDFDAVQKFGSVLDRAAIQAQVAETVKSILDGCGAQAAELPEFRLLPVSLQCLPSSTLNELVKQAAVGQDARVVGAYPEAVIVQRHKR